MRAPRSMFALLALSLAGCSGEPTSPAAGVAGSYLATVPGSTGAAAYGSLVVTSTQNGVTTPVDVRGSEIGVLLAADGSTTGRLYVPSAPAGAAPSAGIDADLAGTWSLAGDVVTLHHAADTFLRDMPLTVHGDELLGDATFGGVRVQLTLVKR
jgi:hypothetical protein